jgi:hypothetical protein
MIYPSTTMKFSAVSSETIVMPLDFSFTLKDGPVPNVYFPPFFCYPSMVERFPLKSLLSLTCFMMLLFFLFSLFKKTDPSYLLELKLPISESTMLMSD